MVDCLFTGRIGHSVPHSSAKEQKPMPTIASRLPLVRALTHRAFTLLWAGQTVSRLGDHLHEVVLAWWVLQATGSAAAMATVFSLTLVPTLLFLLIGGVAVDRYPRARLMLAADIGRGALMLAMALLALNGQLQIEAVYAVSLAFGLLNAFFNPAYTALIPTLVPSADLPSANSLTSLSIQTGRIVGPALGVTLMTTLGIGWAILANALTFFVSAAFLLPLAWTESRPQPDTPPATGWRQIRAELRQGIAEVTGNRWLWINILVFAIVNITLSGPYTVAMPFLVNATMGEDATRLGFLYAMFAVGYGLAGIWLGRRTEIRRRGLQVLGGTAVAGLMLALFGLGLPLPILLIAAVINGFALEASTLAWISSVQEAVPLERLGRVASVEEIGSIALIPLGYAAAGWATTQLGPAPTFLLGGLITAGLTVGLLMGVPMLRRFD